MLSSSHNEVFFVLDFTSSFLSWEHNALSTQCSLAFFPEHLKFIILC